MRNFAMGPNPPKGQHSQMFGSQFGTNQPHMNMLPANQSLSPSLGNSLGNSGSPVPSGSSVEEELIPTAIVIKNIPFAIKKEQLLEVLTTLGLPIPYAFNYHFDNGVFRGLAFANFTTPEETSAVINNLNGREIGGRKLRVEYKKMLPLAERDRIEREKRERRGQLEEQHRATAGKNMRNHQQHHHHGQQQQQPPQHHQHQPLQKTQLGISSSGGNVIHSSASSPGIGGFPMPAMNTGNPSSQSPGFPPAQGLSPGQGMKQANTMKVDLNNPQTLEFYSKILLFADDKKRNELSFPATLSTAQRRTLMALCNQQGVYFSIQDKGTILVTKQPPHMAPPYGMQQQLQSQQSSQLQQQQQQVPPGLFDGAGHGLHGHSSASATNLSSFMAQSPIGLQHPQPHQPAHHTLHSQSSHNNLLYQQSQQQQQQSQSQQQPGQFGGNAHHNVLRGTKSYADIRAPLAGYSASSPGTPSSSPFFPSQTPPPQHQQNLPPLSLSLQQQRSGYQYMPVQSQSQNFAQYQQPQLSGSSSLHNFSNNSQNDFSNAFSSQQFGVSSFGPSSTGGVGALTDSFSNLLKVGGNSLSRVPSLTNIPGSLTAPGSVGSSPTGSISSIHGLDGSTTTSKLNSNSNSNAGVIGSKLSGSDVKTNNNVNDSNEVTLNHD